MILKSIDKKIIKLYEEHKRKEKIIIHLKNIDRLIVEKEAAIIQIEAEIKKEEQDIHKLESLNLYRIFQTILGNQEEQLERERQEFLLAILKHKGCLKSLEALKEERELVNRTISGQFSLEKNLNKLLKEKEKRILAAKNDVAYAEVLESIERISGHRCKIEEVREAIREGKNTQNTLDKVITDLETLDRWHSGLDFPVSAKGKIQVKRIEKNIYKANNNIQRFYEELLDLHDHFSLDYENQIASIKDFLQQLVDSLITDWVVKMKLHNSLNLIANINDKITLMISMLELEMKKTNEYIELEEELKKELMVKVLKNAAS